MQLPTQSAPEYSAVLPLTKVEVKFRPFLVKEQRNMLLVKEDSDTKSMFNTLITMLKSVMLSDNVKIENLPMTDIEFLFLQVRSKSVGETQELTLPCVKEDCDGRRVGTMDMSNINVDTTERDESNIIELNEDLSIELELPSATKMVSIADLSEDKLLNAILLLSRTKIYDKENIYDLKDHRDSEIQEFIDNMSVEQFNSVSRFFSKIPTISVELKTVCQKCKHKHEESISGFANFF